MNNNSYICKFIDAHPTNWKLLLQDRNIKVKFESEEKDVAIFNYDLLADFTDPIVQEARGIIINTKTKEVLCWPFRKFGNSYEFYVDDIDWSTASVQEKVDGSIIKLWYNHDIGIWIWSSNSCIHAVNAKFPNGFTLADIILKCPQFSIVRQYMESNILVTDFTYIFELVSPYNQIVVRYTESTLYHIGTRNNITGEEYSSKLEGIPCPKLYPLSSEKDCIEAASHLNSGYYPSNEGFVVVDNNWHRIKIKSPEYVVYHHTVNNGCITKAKAYKLIKDDDFDLNVFLKEASPYAADVLKYYKAELDKAEADAKEAILQSRKWAEEGLSRKEIALKIKSNKLAPFYFKALDNDSDPEQIINEFGDKILSTMKEYSNGVDKQ